MKKILYLFLTVSLIFSSCKKEEGCMDSAATNYNADADEQDDASSCMYAITGYVWETTSIVLDGANVPASELWYFNNDGTVGTETYDATDTYIGYGLWDVNSSAANVFTFSGTAYNPDGSINQANVSVTCNVDIMTNATNMTWRYVNYPTASSTYVKTLVRSNTYSLSDFK